MFVPGVLLLQSFINATTNDIMRSMMEIGDRVAEQNQMTKQIAQLDAVAAMEPSANLKRAIRAQREAMGKTAAALTNHIAVLKTYLDQIQGNKRDLQGQKDQLSQA